LKFTPQSILDIILIEPTIHGDFRGYFAETFRQDLFENTLNQKVTFVQDNESKSSMGIVRGLHYQLPPFSQSKLVRVTEGKILDVVLDIRKGSNTFGQHISVELSAKNMHQLYIPCGFAHGFVVLSETAKINYKVDNIYKPEYDRGIAFDDPKLKIDWQLPREKLQLSSKDKLHPNLYDSIELFD
jgi:dTDP-4-dehydrorhamnose 3,5-epimerase|tara:strand:- start:1003 stop:1557 length:555 start_codon:yes stop_codon:yes gene_type:complete